MRSDRRGDMGFTESMLSAMAVTVVLMAFIASSATAIVTESDPMGGFDPSRLGGTVEDGVLVPDHRGYLLDHMSRSGCTGISVEAEVPGGFVGPGEPVTVGSMDGPLESRRFLSMLDAGDGRVLPVVYEVTVCG